MGSSVASGESGVTGTTMQSALDRYLMGEAESDVTSADDSDVSGSYMGGDEGQWRMGGSETEDETIDLGPGSAESGGEGRQRRSRRPRDDDEEVDMQALMRQRQAEAEQSRVRERHLRRIKRNQKLHSSATALRTLALWMLVGFTSLFAVPFGAMFALDSSYEALIRAQFVAGRLSEAVVRETLAVARLEWERSGSPLVTPTSGGDPWSVDRGWTHVGRDVRVRPSLLQAEAGTTAQEVATLHRALALGATDSVTSPGGDSLAAVAQSFHPEAATAVVPLASRLEIVTAGVLAARTDSFGLQASIGRMAVSVRRFFDGSAAVQRYETSRTSLFQLGELVWRSAALLASPTNASTAVPDPTELSAAALLPYLVANSTAAIPGMAVGTDGAAYGVEPAPGAGSGVGPGVVSARPLSSMNASGEFWAVLDNGPTSFVDGLAAVAGTRQAEIRRSVVSMLWVLGVSVCLEAVLPVIAVLVVLLPAFGRIGRERVDTFRVFLRVGHSVVLRLSKMPIHVENREDESDSSSDDGGRRGGGHHQHHAQLGSQAGSAAAGHGPDAAADASAGATGMVGDSALSSPQATQHVTFPSSHLVDSAQDGPETTLGASGSVGPGPDVDAPLSDCKTSPPGPSILPPTAILADPGSLSSPKGPRRSLSGAATADAGNGDAVGVVAEASRTGTSDGEGDDASEAKDAAGPLPVLGHKASQRLPLSSSGMSSVDPGASPSGRGTGGFELTSYDASSEVPRRSGLRSRPGLVGSPPPRPLGGRCVGRRQSSVFGGLAATLARLASRDVYGAQYGSEARSPALGRRGSDAMGRRGSVPGAASAAVSGGCACCGVECCRAQQARRRRVIGSSGGASVPRPIRFAV